MKSPTDSIGFDVWDEDGLLIDDQPQLFVNLDVEPIVFTVRGLQYLRPRFKHVGINIASLRTRNDFQSSMRTWLATEWVLLNEKVDAAAQTSTAANPHQVLQAILSNDIDAAERNMSRLEHRRRAGLKVV